jgi:prepilin-type N-terminal cleavage/methylation domain-containing protein
MSRRRGFTLVELLAVMALMTALAGFFVKLLIETMRWGAQQALSVRLTEQSFRLSDVMREDVHQAGTVTVQDGALVIRMADGSTVRYFLDPEKSRLRRSAADSVVQAAWWPCRAARWTVSSDGLVEGRLELFFEGTGRVFTSVPLVIEAAGPRGNALAQ